MRLGIVGNGADKFTAQTEARAREAMREFAQRWRVTSIVSGHSPLGGVDWWAEALADELRVLMIVHAPTHNGWEGQGGYRERNLKIVASSDLVLCVVAETWPLVYRGRRFTTCYHCRDRNPPHVKSGGCWTAWKANARAWRIIGERGVREGNDPEPSSPY